jgi:hypothetical protein
MWCSILPPAQSYFPSDAILALERPSAEHLQVEFADSESALQLKSTIDLEAMSTVTHWEQQVAGLLLVQ